MATAIIQQVLFPQGGYAVNRTRQVFLATALSFRERLPWLGVGPGAEHYAQPAGGVRGVALLGGRDLVYLDRNHRVIGIRRGRWWRLERPCRDAAGALELPPGTVERTQTQVGDEVAICAQA